MKKSSSLNNFILLLFLLSILKISYSQSSIDCSSPDNLSIIHSCLACNYKWEISLNKCIAKCDKPLLFYNNQTMKCEDCPDKCESCSAINSCDSCMGNLKYNYDQNKCICAIEGCASCDFKGVICRQCSEGYEQDINLNCIKSQHKIIISPTTGISLQTLFTFSLQSPTISNVISKNQNTLFKCIIVGHNTSANTINSISTSSCSFQTYLPTLNQVEIHIFEYTIEESTTESNSNNNLKEINHYIMTENLYVSSQFSSLNNLWEYINQFIKPLDNIEIQINSLYEYQYQVNNICQDGNYCQKQGQICYKPSNQCLCGSNTNQGMRDCSSMGKDQIQFNSYLNNVYNICINSIKGLQYNVICPKPITDDIIDEDEQKIISFVLQQSQTLQIDEDFIEVLRTTLNKLNNNSILQEIFPIIVERYVGKYHKIFSKTDSNMNVMLIYRNIQKIMQIDYSVFLSGQIPIQFYETSKNTENQNDNNNHEDLENLQYLQDNFQQLIFSNYPQRVINKYNEKYGKIQQYIKIIIPSEIELLYSFNQENELEQSQMICLQGNQSVLDGISKRDELQICDQMKYDNLTNQIKCNCIGDTFIFINDTNYLYLNPNQYNQMLFNNDNNDNNDNIYNESSISNNTSILIAVLALCSFVLFVLLIILARRKSKTSQLEISCVSPEKQQNVVSNQKVYLKSNNNNNNNNSNNNNILIQEDNKQKDDQKKQEDVAVNINVQVQQDNKILDLQNQHKCLNNNNKNQLEMQKYQDNQNKQSSNNHNDNDNNINNDNIHLDFISQRFCSLREKFKEEKKLELKRNIQLFQQNNNLNSQQDALEISHQSDFKTSDRKQIRNDKKLNQSVAIVQIDTKNKNNNNNNTEFIKSPLSNNLICFSEQNSQFINSINLNDNNNHHHHHNNHQNENENQSEHFNQIPIQMTQSIASIDPQIIDSLDQDSYQLNQRPDKINMKYQKIKDQIMQRSTGISSNSIS